MLRAAVHPASVQDRDGIAPMLNPSRRGRVCGTSSSGRGSCLGPAFRPLSVCRRIFSAGVTQARISFSEPLGLSGTAGLSRPTNRRSRALHVDDRQNRCRKGIFAPCGRPGTLKHPCRACSMLHQHGAAPGGDGRPRRQWRRESVLNGRCRAQRTGRSGGSGRIERRPSEQNRWCHVNGTGSKEVLTTPGAMRYRVGAAHGGGKSRGRRP